MLKWSEVACEVDMKQKIKVMGEFDYSKHYFATVRDDVQQLLKPLNQYGINYFSYSSFNRNNEEEFLSTDFTSCMIYVNEKYYQNLFCGDPDDYQNGAVLWSDIANSCPAAAKMFGQFKQEAGVANGVVITEKYQDKAIQFYFAGDWENYWLNSFYMNNLDILYAFIRYFKESGAGLLKQASQHKVYVPNAGDKTLLAMKDNRYWHSPHIAEKQLFASKLYGLTKRELECIDYLAKGYTYKMIAKVMDISHRTVEKHLSSAKEKTGSNNLCKLGLLVAAS